MSDKNLNLGKILFNIRTEKGLSLREFSEKLNISHAYLNKLEKGIDPRTGKDVTPTIETLTKISAGMGMQLTELLTKGGYLDGVEEAEYNALNIIEELEEECDEEPVLELGALIKEFLDAILEAETISFNGNKIKISQNEILALAAREILSYVKISSNKDEDAHTF